MSFFFYMQVDTDDDLPKLICIECVKHIQQCYEFKNNCLTNEEKLNQILTNDEDIIKQEISVDPAAIYVKNEFHDYSDNLASSDESDNIVESPEIKQEIVLNNKTSKYQCTDCDRTFASKYNLIRHTRMRHNNVISLFKCTQCDQQFKHKESLQRHTKKKHELKKELCKICNKYYNYLSSHVKLKHSTDLKYSCTECPERFSLKNILNKHILSKHKGIKFGRVDKLCTLCGKVLHSQIGLDRHIRSHSDIRLYQCTYCNKKFKTGEYLKKHERLHTNERPFICSYCSKTFRTREVMLIHIRIHTGDKPYKCLVCEKAFTQKQQLKAHMKSH